MAFDPCAPRPPRATAVILRDGRVLLMGRIKEGRKYFTFVGGGREEAETMEQALMREVKEELNIDILNCELMFKLFSPEREECFFLVTEFLGEPVVGGPELARASATNVYIPTWIDMRDLVAMNDLIPEIAKLKVGKYLEEYLSRGAID